MFCTTPYINIEKVMLPESSMPCVVYDMSGQVSFVLFYHSKQGRYRENWSFFYPDVDGIFFVVDCYDKDRLPIVQEILEEMARHPGLAGRKIPFVIMANKQDMEDSVDDLELTKFIQIDKLKVMNDLIYSVKPVIGLSGYNVDKSFKFFEQYAK